LPFATALVIIVVSVLLLTTPLWMHFALRSANVVGHPFGPSQADYLSDRTVNSLFFAGDFSEIGTSVNGFYSVAEAAHLRDARMLLWLGIALAVASAILIGAALMHRRKDAARWRAVARGGAGLAVGTVVIGVIGYFAFDQLFVLFHEVFFPGGNWEFPADSNMIRLYPYAFWELTALALGVLCVIGGGAMWFVARRMARRVA
jgi:integral membrane protein (TIGR01906 family)